MVKVDILCLFTCLPNLPAEAIAKAGQKRRQDSMRTPRTRTCLSGRQRKVYDLIKFGMRVSLFCTIITFCSIQLLLASHVKAQSIDSVYVELGMENEPLRALFNKINNATMLRFVFTESQVAVFDHISLPYGKRTVRQTLEMALRETDLTYFVVSTMIGITKKVPLQPQVESAPITGTVVDKSGNPIPGVSIFIKGTNIGTVTDGEGRFSIAAKEDDVLVFSFIGYRKIEESVAARVLIKITLEEETNVLQEVQINAGYYSITDEERTGSIARVSSKEIERQPVQNVLQALQGRMPGVSIDQSSGVPGSNFRVRIRGTNSLSSGNDPFYIIDGVPFISQTMSGPAAGDLYLTNFDGSQGVSPMNMINPSEIESIEVLKDADATAIYGSRGANGVILITTKKGKSGGTKFNLDFKSGASKVTGFIDLLNTKQYIDMRMQAVENDKLYRGGNGNPAPYEYDLNTWSKTRYTDWQKVLIGGTARMNDLNASLSGGTNNTRFLFSTGYNDQNTVFPGDTKATRFSTHFSVSHLSKDEKLDIKLSSTYGTTRSNLIARDLTPVALRLAPNAPELYDGKGNLNWENGTWGNPLANLENIFSARTYNFLTGVEVGYSIFRTLKVKANVGLNDIRYEQKTTNSSDSYNPASNPSPANSVLWKTAASTRSLIIEPQVSYQTDVSKGKLDILLGGTYQAKADESVNETFVGFASNDLIENPEAAARMELGSYMYSDYRYAALFGRINYNWAGKYILNLTGRRDGSSRFGPGRKFTNMGALGFAWVFSNEKFFGGGDGERSRIMSFGKLRTSYGRTGNDQIGNYQYLDTWSPSAQYGDASSLVPSRLFNPVYAWEINNKFEAALETGFLNDRLLFNAAFYSNQSSSQLVYYKLAGTTGFNSIFRNFPAKIANRGLELELTTVNIKSENWTWTTAWNITFPKNELVEFPGLASSSYADVYVVGQPLSIQKVYHYLGMNTETGVYKFEDVNKDGQITPDDKQAWMIYGQQKYFGGINNSISFKGLKIDVFVQVASQYGSKPDPLGQLGGFVAFGYPTGNQPVDVVINSWQGPGDNAGFQYPSRSLALDKTQDFYAESDARGMIVRFARLKNVSVSYEVPRKWTGGIMAQIYVQAQNLLVLSNYKGLDPETGTASLPPLRTFVAGIRLTL